MRKSSNTGIVLIIFAILLTLFNLSFTTQAKAQIADTTAVTKKPLYKLLYCAYNGYGNCYLYTANYDGTNPQRIPINLPKNMHLAGYSPAISPDHKTIFFTSAITKGDDEIIQPYACDIDGSNARPIFGGNVTGLTHYAPVTGTQPYKLLYCVTVNSDATNKFYIANYDGTNPQLIHINLPKGRYLGDFLLAISPDHKTIFFDSYIRRHGRVLDQPYACDIDGRNAHPILNGNVASLLAYPPVAETPLCKLLYFAIDNDNGNSKLYSANYDGTNPQRIPIKSLPKDTRFHSRFCAISPDHKTMFFDCTVTRRGNFLFPTYACNIDGSNLHPILDGNVVLDLLVY